MLPAPGTALSFDHRMLRKGRAALALRSVHHENDHSDCQGP